MINLRFHMVSLVAVFFALAIGIAIGATVVDQGVLNQTERRLSSFDTRLQQRDRSLSALRKELRAQKILVDQLGPKANIGRLVDRTFVVVAANDVAIELIRATSRTLSAAGADLAGTYKLDRSLELRSPDSQRKARTLLSLPVVEGEGAMDGLRDALDARLAQTFAAPLLAPAMNSLVDAGFVDLIGSTKPVTLPSKVEIVVLERSVGPAEPAINGELDVTGVSDSVSSVSAPAVLTATAVPTVSAPEEILPARSESKIALRFVFAVRAIDAHRVTVALHGASLVDTMSGAIRAGELRDAVSTIDGIDTVAGASSLVFALLERVDADASHFGVLRGARRRIAR